LGNIVGEMTNKAAQLEDRFLVFAVQAAALLPPLAVARVNSRKSGDPRLSRCRRR
jgi:hypothetical protein